MFELILKGALLGLANSLTPGPLMLLIIRDSLTKNWKNSLLVAVSSFFADIPIVIIAFSLGSQFIKFKIIQIILSIAGAGLLLFFALQSFKIKGGDKGEGSTEKSSFFDGLLATLLNPHPYLFWILAGVPWGMEALRKGTAECIIYFLSFQLVFVGTNVSLVFIVKYLGRNISQLTLKRLSILSGLLFIFLAVFLMKEMTREL